MKQYIHHRTIAMLAEHGSIRYVQFNASDQGKLWFLVVCSEAHTLPSYKPNTCTLPCWTNAMDLGTMLSNRPAKIDCNCTPVFSIRTSTTLSHIPTTMQAPSSDLPISQVRQVISKPDPSLRAQICWNLFLPGLVLQLNLVSGWDVHQQDLGEGRPGTQALFHNI